jgi:hypothetical protein
MRKLALILLVALVLPATAAAKGPSKASIAGAGLTTIRISGAEGSATPFWRLVEATGWFEAAWGPSRLPQEPPQGELGPRYTITWTVPSSSRLHQDLYPYAKPYPLTYMPRGQKIWDTTVKGGWFAGGAKLEKVLHRVGLPAEPPAQPPAEPGSTLPPTPAPSTGSDLPAGALAGIAAAAAFLALALARGAMSLRRRSSGAAGT